MKCEELINLIEDGSTTLCILDDFHTSVEQHFVQFDDEKLQCEILTTLNDTICMRVADAVECEGTLESQKLMKDARDSLFVLSKLAKIYLDDHTSKVFDDDMVEYHVSIIEQILKNIQVMQLDMNHMFGLNDIYDSFGFQTPCVDARMILSYQDAVQNADIDRAVVAKPYLERNSKGNLVQQMCFDPNLPNN